MRILFNFFFVFILFVQSFTTFLQAQPLIDNYRTLENRVKYAYPDSLKIFANALDKSKPIHQVLRIYANGKCYFYKSKFDSAYTQLTLAKSLAQSANCYRAAAEIALEISKCLMILENIDYSLQEILFAQSYFDDFGDDRQKAKVKISLGELYRKVGQYDKALRVLKESKRYALAEPDLLASYYNRMAAVKSETSDMDSAYYYSHLALKEAGKTNDVSLLAVSENELGYILKHKNKKDSSIYHFQRADSIFQSCNMTAYALQSRAHYAILYSERNEYNKALPLLINGYQIATKNKWYRLMRDYAECIRNTYAFINNKDSFYRYQFEMQNAHIQLIESQNAVNSRLVESMYHQQKYQEELDSKEQLLQTERLKREQADTERKTLVILIVLGFFVLILTFYAVYFQIKRKKEVLSENRIKESQNRELKELLNNNEALIYEMSHRVKNNLSVLSGLLSIQKSRAENEELQSTLQVTIQRIDSISSIHNLLYDNKEKAFVDLQLSISELAASIAHSMGYDFNSKFELSMEKVMLDISRAINISMILNELITNVFKHSSAKESDKVLLSLSEENDNVSITISEKGKGFDLESKIRTNESEKSLGLYLVSILCRQLRATLISKSNNEYFEIILAFKR